ncbi:MAG: aminoacyl-tRNA hydrolase [bacterium]
MKCIVGLGNPGEKYQFNRHNVGFMVVDKVAEQVTSEKWEMKSKFNAEIIQTKEYVMVKPQTFMNDSGVAVSAICRFYKIKNEDLYIVHDDLDIEIGNYKIQHGKGPKVHNGLSSVEEKMGTDKFWNVRIGVENREVRGNSGIPGVVYSLQNFSPEEREIIDGVIAKVVDELKAVVSL